MIRAGLWLGVSWGVVEVGLQGVWGPVTPGPALAEVALNALVWAGLAALLGRLVRRVGHRPGSSVGPVLLMGLFFAAGVNLLIHPFLLAGVELLSSRGFAFALVFASLPFLPAILALVYLWRRRGSQPSFPAPGLWLLAALLLGGITAFGREELTRWSPGTGRIPAALSLALVCEAAVLAALLWLRSERALGPLATALALVALAYPVPQLARWSGPQPPPSAPAGSTPVILISLDTTRPDHLSFFGYAQPTSPRLDEFLAEARVFRQAYATSPWTVPSHASVFTGLYAAEHGAHYREAAGPGELPQSMTSLAPTLAERFGARGYATAAIASNRLAVSPELGLDRGFQLVRADLRAGDRPVPLSLVKSADRLLDVRWLARLAAHHRTAPEVTDRALRWVRDHADEPFFLLVNYLDPHFPYAPPEPMSMIGRKVGWRERLSWAWGPAENGADSVDAYDGEIHWMDAHVGRFLDGLRSLGLLDRALIVVFSDHGEFLGEGGQWGHGKDLHELVLRVLLAVRYPDGRDAGTDTSPASLADIPRLLEEALQEMPPGSLLPRRDAPWVLGEDYQTASEMRRTPRRRGAARLVAVRWGDWKLIDAGRESMLFELGSDSDERDDVTPLHPEITGTLRDFAIHWKDTTRLRGARGEPADAADMRERLRELGYVE